MGEGVILKKHSKGKMPLTEDLVCIYLTESQETCRLLKPKSPTEIMFVSLKASQVRLLNLLTGPVRSLRMYGSWLMA